MVLTLQGLQLKSLIKAVQTSVTWGERTRTEAPGPQLQCLLFINSCHIKALSEVAAHTPAPARGPLLLAALMTFTIIYHYLGNLVVFWFIMHLFFLKKNA